MRIERNHNLGQPEAIHRIDMFLDEVSQRPFPGGVTIEAPAKEWSGNVLKFSFKVKKGWLGTTIAGNVSVTGEMVVLESDLPDLLTRFVSEDYIRALVNQELDTLLQA